MKSNICCKISILFLTSFFLVGSSFHGSTIELGFAQSDSLKSKEFYTLFPEPNDEIEEIEQTEPDDIPDDSEENPITTPESELIVVSGHPKQNENSTKEISSQQYESMLSINQSVNPKIIQNVLSENACSINRPSLNVIFSIDSSPSMLDNDPNNLRLVASKAFIDKLDPKLDKAAVVSWGETLGFKSHLTNNFTQLKNNIDKDIDIISGTDYNIGMHEAVNTLDIVDTNENTSQIIIFLSDGQHNAYELPPIPGEDNSILDYAKNKQYKIYTIGLNITEPNDQKYLELVSSYTGGKFFATPSADNLNEIFNSIFVQEIEKFEFENAEVNISVEGSGGRIEHQLPIDVILSIDSSSSMKKTDPSNQRLSAAKLFIDKLDSSLDKIGLVTWSKQLKKSIPLTSDFPYISQEIDSIEITSGTDLNIGLDSAISLLDNDNSSQHSSSKAIILLSDGASDVPVDIGSLTSKANVRGYKIYAIGLSIDQGSEIESQLKDIASQTGGKYHASPTSKNLESVYNEIFEKIVESSTPSNMNLSLVLPKFVTINQTVSSTLSLDGSQISTNPPNKANKNREDQLMLVWDDFSKNVGNKDDKLSSNESFNTTFTVSFTNDVLFQWQNISNADLSSNATINLIENEQEPDGSMDNTLNITSNPHEAVQYNETMLKIPIIDERNSYITYLDSNGKTVIQKMLPLVVDLNLRTCNHQELTNLTQSSDIIEKEISFLNYEDSNNSYNIKYPETWTQDGYGSSIRFSSPADHSYDRYLESINIDILQAYEATTLDEYVKLNIEHLKNSLSDFKLIDHTNSKLADYPSEEIIYTFNDPTVEESKALAEIAIINDKIYIISYFAHDTNYESNLNIAEEMIRSFAIL